MIGRLIRRGKDGLATQLGKPRGTKILPALHIASGGGVECGQGSHWLRLAKETGHQVRKGDVALQVGGGVARMHGNCYGVVARSA